MKKRILFILFIILFVPIMVHAESGYLYDVLKNEAESNGVAKEYTGNHKDSFTRTASKKIYHWYAEDDTEGTQVREKDNVIFAGFCWAMVRTTDTGGVKLLFNGTPSNGDCSSPTGPYAYDSEYGTQSGSIADVGYMYNSKTSFYTGKPVTGAIFGQGVVYENGQYTLTDTVTSYDRTHHYTCNNTTGTCTSVRYYFSVSTGSQNFYYYLSSGFKFEDLIQKNLYADDVNLYDSKIKNNIDRWYQNNMTNYTIQLEETIYCNDRNITDYGSMGPISNAPNNNKPIVFGTADSKDLSCTYETDQFSIDNPKAKLKYPVGFLTLPEVNLYNNAKARSFGYNFWLGTPTQMWFSTPSIYYLRSAGTVDSISPNSEEGQRPVISLKAGTEYISGDGSKANPYIIKELAKSNITIINDTNKGIVSIDKTTQVVETSMVTLSIESKEGYVVDHLDIKDTYSNIIEYQVEDNTYSFEMPGSNTTITVSYRKVKSSVNVEIVNETKDLNIEINDITQVEYQEVVRFVVTPIKGYQVNSIRIVDEENHEIEYIETSNQNEYEFVMPAMDVTIIPSYERVSSAITVEDNENTKEIKIEVNNVRAVVYEETVRFTIIPDEGYELEDIIITDTDQNRIAYRKTNKDYEYEFVMPDTDVVIRPVYRKLETNTDPTTNPITNPKTQRNIFIIGLVLLLINGCVYTLMKKKTQS